MDWRAYRSASASIACAAPLPFAAGVRLFEFVGYDVLRPDFHASQSSVPGAAHG